MRRRYHFGTINFGDPYMDSNTPEFDELCDMLRGSAEVHSARVIKDNSGAAPIFAAHMLLDGREYVASIVPTDLTPPEDQS